MTYEQARAAVQAAGWTTQQVYRKNWRQIPGLPSAPEQVYREWQDWRTFLGTARRFLTLEEASAAVQAQGYQSSAEYEARYQEVEGLPSNPDRFYEEFPGWGTFLGTGRTRRQPTPLSFAEARTLARSLGLGSSTEYFQKVQEDHRLPTRPTAFPEWQGWEDFLQLPGRLSYIEASQVVREMGVTDARAYARLYRQHSSLPSMPSEVYPEWQGWAAFLGQEEGKPSRFLSYDEACRTVRRAGIISFRQYSQVYRQYPGLPSTPNKVYSEWQGWEVFLKGN
ncbi:integrase repeat-containing protein [Deinococcus metallilatus]|uniref:Uncharacterized protein n=1 Tax=Deinococcus metallilatus TaxID=1211322 RepID=A0ABR6MQ09_9DEIO|nr:integrase repeat-containing protein [Deinococcus metallilatus]MBB5293410.1 hypothetical protein [Deinococcus metallilatus]